MGGASYSQRSLHRDTNELRNRFRCWHVQVLLLLYCHDAYNRTAGASYMHALILIVLCNFERSLVYPKIEREHALESDEKPA